MPKPWAIRFNIASTTFAEDLGSLEKNLYRNNAEDFSLAFIIAINSVGSYFFKKFLF